MTLNRSALPRERGAYYNENDPKAAAWLRELIKQNLIAPGDVDERSITDVKGCDLEGYAQCHFFAGIGGWSHALRLAGWPDDRPVWTGSCPCQPFSDAGDQKGEADKRHLWPELRRLLAERNPAICLGEQVASKLGRQWLARVRADLEALGYGVGAADLCAAGVAAPHIRQRLYWLAVTERERARLRESIIEGQARIGRNRSSIDGAAGGLADGTSRGCGELRGTSLARSGRHADGGGAAQWMGDTGSERVRTGGPGSTGEAATGVQRTDGERQRLRADAGEYGASCGLGIAIEPGLEGHAGHGDDGNQPGWIGTQSDRPTSETGTVGGLADAEHDGGRRDEQGRGPEGRTADRRLNPWIDFDILHCTDGKARRIEPGTFPLAHGIPARVGRLRGYGNAIVPQVAATFIEAAVEALNAESEAS